MNIGPNDFTNFRNVRVRGNIGDAGGGPGMLRVVAANGIEGTLSVNTTYQDQNFAWTLPAKSGTFGVSGTFAIDLPVVASGGYQSTAITLTGVRAEDGVIVVPQNIVPIALQSARGALVVSQVVPTANTLTLTLVNPFATATVAVTQGVMAYTLVR